MRLNHHLLDISIIIFVVLAWVWTRSRTRHRRNAQRLPLPPGPKGFPLVGNAFQLPSPGIKAWLTFTEWRNKYGDVAYAEIFGRSLVVLNSYKAAFDLLEKRSSIYSCRPSFTMACDLMDFQWFLTTLPLGERHRKHRSLLHRFLQPKAVKEYADIQTRETHRLLGDLLQSPNNFAHHIRRCAGAVIMMITYGHEVAPEGDTFIALSDNAIQILSQAGSPGRYFVDFLPWLKYVPDWFPGAGFKQDAKEGCAASHAVLHIPYNMTKERIRNGTAPSSMMSNMLEANADEDGHIRDEDIIAGCTAVTYAGGSDTVISSLLSVVLALALHPEVQERAQDELDRVVGKHRFPTFEDRDSLPYFEGIVREALRWNPTTPLGVAHRVVEDDVYNGYFIPSGSIILANQWAMLHDGEEYPDPFTFSPERWLTEDGKISDVPRHPGKVAFGFGRRICPGRHLAESSIFIGAACIVSAFNIGKALDEMGNSVTPIVDYSTGVASHPKAFECSISPRSPRTEALIRQVAERAK